MPNITFKRDTSYLLLAIIASLITIPLSIMGIIGMVFSWEIVLRILDRLPIDGPEAFLYLIGVAFAWCLGIMWYILTLLGIWLFQKKIRKLANKSRKILLGVLLLPHILVGLFIIFELFHQLLSLYKEVQFRVSILSWELMSIVALICGLLMVREYVSKKQ